MDICVTYSLNNNLKDSEAILQRRKIEDFLEFGLTTLTKNLLENNNDS